MFESYLKPPVTFPTLTGSIVTFNSQYAGLPLKSHVVEVVATQSGSGTPSPDNVRTINGVSSFGVFDSDYNLIDANVYYGQYKSGDAYITSGTNFTTIRIPIGAFVGKQITFSAYLKPSSGLNYMRVRAWIKNNNAYTNGNSISGGSEGYSSVTITPSSVFDFLNITFGSGGGNNVEVSNVQLEYGDTRTDYHVFNGQSFTIQIGSTVYGGEYDARTGVLTVTHIYIKPTSTATISSFSHTANNTWIFVIQGFSAVTRGDAISNINIVDTYGNTTGNGFCKATTNYPVFSLNDADNNLNASSSAADIRTAFANFVNSYSPEAVYELATPQTIQLPPCPIDTLLENNIWADTGDTTLQYPKFG